MQDKKNPFFCRFDRFRKTSQPSQPTDIPSSGEIKAPEAVQWNEVQELELPKPQKPRSQHRKTRVKKAPKPKQSEPIPNILRAI